MTTIQPTQTNHKNRISHTAILAISLGLGAATGGLWYKFGNSYMDADGKLRDEFIKTTEEYLTEAKDKDFIKDTKWLADKHKEIDNLKNVDEVLKYYLKNESNLSEQDKKVVTENIPKMELERAKKFVKAGIEVSDERYNKYFTDLFEKAYNKSKKEFVFDSNKISTTQFDCIKEAAKNVNSAHAVKNGIIVTLIGLVCGYALRWAFGKSD